MGPVETKSEAALLPAICHSFCNGQRGWGFLKSKSFSILVVSERSILSLDRESCFSTLVVGERFLLSFERESCNGETRDDSEADEKERGEGSTQDELVAGEGGGLLLNSPLFLKELGMFP